MEETNHQSRRVFSRFDEMSNEALEEILRADYMLPESEASDAEEILYITELLAKRECGFDQGESATVDDAWASFNQNYRPSANDEGTLYDFAEDKSTVSERENLPDVPAGRQRPGKKRRVFKYMAAAAAALLLVIGSCTFTAKALGYDLGEHIGKWTAEFFSFGTVPSEEEQVSSETGPEAYSPLQAALDNYGITEALAPTWIPDGYFFSYVEVYFSGDDAPCFSAGYQNAELDIIAIDIICPADAITYDEADIYVISYESGGITHYIATDVDYDTASAVWTNNDKECYIQGSNLSVEDMVKMIDSIYE